MLARPVSPMIGDPVPPLLGGSDVGCTEVLMTGRQQAFQDYFDKQTSALGLA